MSTSEENSPELEDDPEEEIYTVDEPLNAEMIRGLMDLDEVEDMDILKTVGSDERVSSLLIQFVDLDTGDKVWQGRHFVTATQEWLVTFNGTDKEALRKKHEQYVAPDYREIDQYRLKNPNRTNTGLTDFITEELSSRGLSDSDIYTINNWEVVRNLKPYLEDAESGTCISFIALLSLGDDIDDFWQGYHLHSELNTWVKTFRSPDKEFIMEAHQRYAIKDEMDIDEFVLGYSDMGKPIDDIDIPDEEPEYEGGTGLADLTTDEGSDTADDQAVE